MPLTWEVEAATGLILIEAKGRIEVDRYLTLWDELMADPRVEAGPNLLADFREVEVTRSGSEVRTVAAGNKRFNDYIEGGRLAVVASQQASFGLARMYEALIESQSLEVQVFRAYEPARAWLIEHLDPE